MYDSVKEVWTDFTIPFEGLVEHMYVDSVGLITVGIGNLIDPINIALPLPFRRKSDGYWATESEITIDWTTLKARKGELAVKGYKACAPLTKVYLEREDIDELVLRKFESNEKVLSGQFPEWDTWPADAQLAVHSMAWLMGPYFPPKWPNLTAALKRQDFLFASDNSLTNARPSARNSANRLLFTNAASVVDLDRDRSRLWWGTEKISVASVLSAANNPLTPSVTAWYVQRMLLDEGAYIARLDGEFGNMSKAALNAYLKTKKLPTGINKAGLAQLSKDSGLKIPVVD